MEFWFVIGIICFVGYIGLWIVTLYENFQFNKMMRRRHMNEMRRAMKQINRSERQKEEEKQGEKLEKVDKIEMENR